MERYTLTVSLNAAVDVAYVIENLAVDRINNVKALQRFAGGKANNCARVLAGALAQRVVATGFASGNAGRFIQDDLKTRGIQTDYEHTHGENRSCFAIVDPVNGTVTEIREKGPTLTEENCERFLVRFRRLLDGAALVILSGSLPPGVPADFYGRLTEAARGQGVPTIVDAAGAALQQALASRPYMVKPNEEELAQWAGRPLTTEADVLDAARSLLAAGPETVLVSLGERGAVAVTPDGAWHGVPPRITPVNTVGSGDSMVAGWAAGICQGLSLTETLRLAVACGTANALTQGVAEVDPVELAHLQQQIQISAVEKNPEP